VTQTVFHQLHQAIASHLQASPLLAGVPITANRGRPVSKDAAVAIDVRLGVSRASATTYTHYEWTTVVAIDCMARTTAAQPAHAAADGLLAACYAAAQGFANTPAAQALAVLEVGDEMTVDAGFDAEDTGLAVLTLLLPVKHETLQITLEPRA
jgi:hypothetical protein